MIPSSLDARGIIHNQNPTGHMNNQVRGPSLHPRTSVEKCRKALGERAADLTDGEIEQMRDFLYQFLDIAGDELDKELLKRRPKADVGRSDH